MAPEGLPGDASGKVQGGGKCVVVVAPDGTAQLFDGALVTAGHVLAHFPSFDLLPHSPRSGKDSMADSSPATLDYAPPSAGPTLHYLPPDAVLCPSTTYHLLPRRGFLYRSCTSIPASASAASSDTRWQRAVGLEWECALPSASTSSSAPIPAARHPSHAATECRSASASSAASASGSGCGATSPTGSASSSSSASASASSSASASVCLSISGSDGVSCHDKGASTAHTFQGASTASVGGLLASMPPVVVREAPFSRRRSAEFLPSSRPLFVGVYPSTSALSGGGALQSSRRRSFASVHSSCAVGSPVPAAASAHQWYSPAESHCSPWGQEGVEAGAHGSPWRRQCSCRCTGKPLQPPRSGSPWRPRVAPAESCFAAGPVQPMGCGRQLLNPQHRPCHAATGGRPCFEPLTAAPPHAFGDHLAVREPLSPAAAHLSGGRRRFERLEPLSPAPGAHGAYHGTGSLKERLELDSNHMHPGSLRIQSQSHRLQPFDYQPGSSPGSFNASMRRRSLTDFDPRQPPTSADLAPHQPTIGPRDPWARLSHAGSGGCSPGTPSSGQCHWLLTQRQSNERGVPLSPFASPLAGRTVSGTSPPTNGTRAQWLLPGRSGLAPSNDNPSNPHQGRYSPSMELSPDVGAQTCSLGLWGLPGRRAAASRGAGKDLARRKSIAVEVRRECRTAIIEEMGSPAHMEWERYLSAASEKGTARVGALGAASMLAQVPDPAGYAFGSVCKESNVQEDGHLSYGSKAEMKKKGLWGIARLLRRKSSELSHEARLCRPTGIQNVTVAVG